jgi:hypothetical protein
MNPVIAVAAASDPVRNQHFVVDIHRFGPLLCHAISEQDRPVRAADLSPVNPSSLLSPKVLMIRASESLAAHRCGRLVVIIKRVARRSPMLPAVHSVKSNCALLDIRAIHSMHALLRRLTWVEDFK